MENQEEKSVSFTIPIGELEFELHGIMSVDKSTLFNVVYDFHVDIEEARYDCNHYGRIRRRMWEDVSVDDLTSIFVNAGIITAVREEIIENMIKNRSNLVW